MKKMIRILAVILIAVFLPLTASAAGGLSFKTTTLAGKSYSSDSMKNYKLTMVNVWAEWCNPCVWEIPFLQQLYAEYDNLLILGVWVGSDKDGAIATAEEAGVNYPLLIPAGDLVDYAYKSQYIPATYFFDANGKQVGEAEGYIGGRDYDSWKSIIDGLLGDAPSPDPDPDPDPSASVTLSKTSLTFKGVKTEKVTATFSDPDDSILDVKSDNPAVAKAVSSGNEIDVSSVKQAGQATITVATAKGASAKISVTVQEGVALNEKKITLKPKKSFKIKVQSIPATLKAKSFTSSKPAVAKVDGKGKVKALRKGSATITVTLTNGKKLKIKVKVK